MKAELDYSVEALKDLHSIAETRALILYGLFIQKTGGRVSVNLNDFDFCIPECLIAHHPVEPRDNARLLVRHYNGNVEHRIVKDLPNELQPGTLLVINDTRVFPSRIFAKTENGGQVEIFLTQPISQGRWRALAKPLRKLRPGTRLQLDQDLIVIVEKREDQFAIIKFPYDDHEVLNWLTDNGFVPLPPYIKRTDKVIARESQDKDSYQTVYARQVGSVAAPTAGLHFTNDLLVELKKNEIELASLCLHVGAGTFLPVQTEQIHDHRMHTERFFLPSTTWQKIYQWKLEKKPIVAVGTTTFRVLESVFQEAGKDLKKIASLCERWRETNIFIRPNHPEDLYNSNIADALWTNFHQPKSTLFMLVSALLGMDEARKVYQVAINNNYRFFSYGDASLLWFTDTSRLIS